MFWIILIFTLLIVLGCYVTYKETKHHELHKMRACFSDIERHIKQINNDDNAKKDPETLEIFKGEIIGIEKVITEIDKEDANYDLIQEIEDDIEKVKEKIAGAFKKKDIA